MKSLNLVRCFAFSAGEFLDEELGELESEGTPVIGQYVHHPKHSHPFQWWTTREIIDEVNQKRKELGL